MAGDAQTDTQTDRLLGIVYVNSFKVTKTVREEKKKKKKKSEDKKRSVRRP